MDHAERVLAGRYRLLEQICCPIGEDDRIGWERLSEVWSPTRVSGGRRLPGRDLA